MSDPFKLKTGIYVFLLMFLTSCNDGNKYRVTERVDTYVDKEGRPVSNDWRADLVYDHQTVSFILTHDGHKVHALCDLSTVNNLDTNASCGLRPLHTYDCVIGSDAVMKPSNAKALSDLTCKDADARTVYLYVSKEE